MLVEAEPAWIRVSMLRQCCAECLNNIRSTCWRVSYALLESQAQGKVLNRRRWEKGVCEKRCWLSREVVCCVEKLPGERMNLWRGMVAGVTMRLQEE